jgi:hypothetical protein
MKFGKNAFAIFDKFLSTCCKIRIRPIVVKIPESSVVLESVVRKKHVS